MGHVRDRWTVLGEPDKNGRRRKVHGPRWGHGKRWQARWTDAHGVERALTFTHEDAAHAHLARVALGIAEPSRSVLTVRDFADDWLSNQLHYAGSTSRAVRMRLDKTILPAIGDMPLSRVDRSDVQRILTGMTGSYAPATVRAASSFLNVMFRTALDDRLIQQNPCARVQVPPKRARRMTAMTAAEVAAMADAVPPWFRSMVLVGAATGLRGAELRGLTWDRVLGDSIQVDRQLLSVLRGGEPEFGPPKSEASIRTVGLEDSAQDALGMHRLTQEPNRWGLVWVTRQGQPVRRTAAADVWKKAAQRTGLPPSRRGWHELRHFCASVLIAAGMSPRAVADHLGHSDPAETLRTYTHWWPSDTAKLREALRVAMGEVSGPSVSVVDGAGRSVERGLVRPGPQQDQSGESWAKP